MEPYVGEIRCFSFGRVPIGWLECDGRQLPIQQYQALYSLLGTQFGGDGRLNFNLPKLNGVVPIHYDPANNVRVGVHGGAETVGLSYDEMPVHTHPIAVENNPGTALSPQGNYLAAPASAHLAYIPSSNSLVATAANNVGSAGVGADHVNMQPYLVLNFCIANTGSYPSRP